MHFAFEQMCYGYDELALTLYEDGRYFAGLPFFEKYKYAPDSFPEVDYSSAGGDLLKEMQLDNEARKERTQGDGFERVPFDYYEQLQETLVDMIPDFRIRLKVDPRTRKMVFAADVHSVFDICWFTLAKKLSEDVTPEEKGTSADVKPAHQGMVMSCPFCGEAYIRTANRAVTCGKPECHRARKAMNKRNSRKRKKIADLQSNPAGKAEEWSPGAFKPPGVPFSCITFITISWKQCAIYSTVQKPELFPQNLSGKIRDNTEEIQGQLGSLGNDPRLPDAI